MTLPAALSRRAAALLVAALSVSALSAPLPALAEDAVLTVTGAVEGGSRSFTLSELEALGEEEYRTATVWTEGEHSFTGVPLGAILEAVGAEGETLHMVAINDYAVTVPIEDAAPGAALIAYRLDGKTMSVREKGPLWLVYPYDADSKWRAEAVYARSIWQLSRIEVKR
ncbi:molybdopterin-dependent oxidoreductase [Rhodovulum sp. DZ06]|uniref:molybdopterin-dependent oxidoreductase n=1 Tax=Rhodovulum sp. DZ06 TaxID=3425126 RepID=UPI003D32A837